jgi:tetratricopeptide (TPR) repeat protein
MCLGLYAQFILPIDPVRARSRLAEAGQIARRLGDRYTLQAPLAYFGRLAMDAVERTEARRLLEQSVALAGELNDLYNQSIKLGWLAELETDEARFAEALALLECCVANYRLLRNRSLLAHALHDLAIGARRVGDADHALRAFEESLALFQDLNGKGEVAALTASMGHLHRQRGASAEAVVTFAESLRVLASQDSELGIATALAGLAMMSLDAGRAAEAACLLGAAEALLERMQAGPNGVYFNPSQTGQLRYQLRQTRPSPSPRRLSGQHPSARGCGRCPDGTVRRAPRSASSPRPVPAVCRRGPVWQFDGRASGLRRGPRRPGRIRTGRCGQHR